MKILFPILSAIAICSFLASCSYSAGKNNSDASNSEIVSESNSDSSNTADEQSVKKTEITLGLAANNPDINEYITKFNASDKSYKIVVKDYNNPDKTVIEMQNDMKIDIIAGNAPDMILCTDSAFYNILYKNDVFADVSAIYDEADILPNIRNICTEENGKIYRVPLGFNVRTAFTKAENGIECCEIYDYRTMKAVVDELDENEELSYNMMNAEYCTRYSLICDFTDLKNYTCNFDSPDFIEALEFYKFIKLNKQAGNTDAAAKMSYIILANTPCIYRIKNNDFGSDEVLLTPPEHARAELNQSITISSFAKGESRKGAEEFIKFSLSDECVNTTNPVFFPITESGLDIAMGLDFDILDENGQKTEAGLSEDEITYYKNYVKSVENEIFYDMSVMGIFQEETENFVNGACTAEQCAEYIQNRSALYLSEQS